jgi:hypothetical protein
MTERNRETRPLREQLEGPDQIRRELERDEDRRHELMKGGRKDDNVTAHDDIPMSERFSR